MTPADLMAELARRAPGAWELYAKRARSREIERSEAAWRSSSRREEGWAVRWWEDGRPRFAAGESLETVAAALADAARVGVAPEPPPPWPSSRSGGAAESPGKDEVEVDVEPAPDLFEPLAQAVSASSRGEATLRALSLRRGSVQERIWNAAGLEVAHVRTLAGGVAHAVGRRGGAAREVRLAFSPVGDGLDAAGSLDALARRLADAATLPLSGRAAPISAGQWLLDPAVASAILAALAPAFIAERPPGHLARAGSAATELSIVDDAGPEAPFDGEGTPTRRVLLVDSGSLVGRLDDLRSAARAGRRSTGHGARPSFRTPPRVSPRRLFFSTERPSPPAELLAGVSRGLFAAALTAPPRVRPAEDRYEVEFTGVSIAGGRAQGPVAGARAVGRVSDLLRRMTRLSSDLQFFPMPFLVGSPTVLVERAKFE